MNTDEVKTFSKIEVENRDFEVEVGVKDDKPKLSAAERLYERHREILFGFKTIFGCSYPSLQKMIKNSSTSMKQG